MLFVASVYFAISNSYCYFHIFFMHYILYFPTFIFTLCVPCFSFILIDHNLKQVLLIKWLIFFLKLKNIFCSFQLFENGHIHNVISTLINVIKLEVENNSIVSTLSNVVNINTEIDNVDLTFFGIVNFNVEIYNAVSKLIWHCPTSWRHITVTTVRPRWKVSWVLTNVVKRLHNFVKFVKLKTYIFSRIPLNCCFCKLTKRYW